MDETENLTSEPTEQERISQAVRALEGEVEESPAPKETTQEVAPEIAPEAPETLQETPRESIASKYRRQMEDEHRARQARKQPEAPAPIDFRKNPREAMKQFGLSADDLLQIALSEMGGEEPARQEKEKVSNPEYETLKQQVEYLQKYLQQKDIETMEQQAFANIKSAIASKKDEYRILTIDPEKTARRVIDEMNKYFKKTNTIPEINDVLEYLNEIETEKARNRYEQYKSLFESAPRIVKEQPKPFSSKQTSADNPEKQNLDDMPEKERIALAVKALGG